MANSLYPTVTILSGPELAAKTFLGERLRPGQNVLSERRS